MTEENKTVENSKEENDIDIGGRIGFIKKIFMFLGVLVAVLLALLIFAQSSINFSHVKGEVNAELATLIKEETGEMNKYGAGASIEGEVSFRSFPVPHIIISDVKGANLTEKNHRFSFDIKNIKIYVSLKDLIAKNIVVNKIEVIDATYNIKETESSEFDMVGKIIGKYMQRLSSGNPNAILVLKNNTLNISGINYSREFQNINLTNTLGAHKISTVGNLLSNRQPLDVGLDLNKNKDDYDGKLHLKSQAFTADLDFRANFSDMKFSGKSNLDLIHFQLFSRTIFNPTSFLYRRVVDNGNLKVGFDFNGTDNVFKLTNISMDGKNISGGGTVELNANEGATSKVNLNLSFLNLDNLIVKDMAGKNKDTRSENISIFSEEEYIHQGQEKYRGYIERVVRKNPLEFDIKARDIQFNSEKISNSELKFSYSDADRFRFEKMSGEFPGNTNILVERQWNNAETINIKGEDMDVFWNFLKNTSSKANKNKGEGEKNNFEFNGTLNVVGNKLFIREGVFTSRNLNSTNEIEVDFDSGISYIAVNSNVDSLVADGLFTRTDGQNIGNIMKNRVLFLNDYTLHTLLKFNIKNLEYAGDKYVNSSFIVGTSRGLLNIYNINLNNKIKGNASVNILDLNPKFDINLVMENASLDDNVDFNGELFSIPTFEDFSGNVRIVGKNLKFRDSSIGNLDASLKMTAGVLNIDKFEIDGFGGKCGVTGFLDMKYNRKLNLTFGGCTADLKDTLYLFTGTKNVEGLIGFSSVLYAEGHNLETFMSTYNLKLQLIGSGVSIRRFGLGKLSSNLFDINSDKNLLNTIDPQAVLYNARETTVFEKLSGTLQYTSKNLGQLDLDISRPFTNGKITGTFDIFSKYASIKLGVNFIMLSGTLQQTVALTLPIAISGNTPNSLSNATNFQQINDYIMETRKQL